MTKSANDIIRDALVSIGVLNHGEAMSSSKSSQGYAALLGMIDLWSLNDLISVFTVEESFNLVAGTNSYTYGTGGTFNSTRPTDIEDSTFVRDGSTDYQVKRKDFAYYRSISDKSTQGTPSLVFFNYEYPLAKVYLYPTPSAALPIHFLSMKPSVTFSDQTTGVDLPPGMYNTLMNNLAITLCPRFGRTASPELVALATSSLDTLKAKNVVNRIRETSTPHLSRMASRRGSYTNINRGPWG